jgi:RecA-family ATPase
VTVRADDLHLVETHGADPPLTIVQWLSCDLPLPDYILGQWLATTTRGLMTADIGLGMTILGLQIAMNISAGENFLHWRGHRRCNTLYIDSEMSRRLLRQRIADATTPLYARACLQLGGLCTRTDQNQTRNTVLFCSAAGTLGIPKSVVE